MNVIVTALVYTFWSLLYSFPIIVFILCIIGTVELCILVKQLANRKYYKQIIALLLMLTIIIIVLFQTEFVKSRKIIDKDWMIGRTIQQVRLRYSYSWNTGSYPEYIDEEKEYVYCVREIIDWNSVDGVTEELRYYVLTDEDGKIVDVKIKAKDGDLPITQYDYSDRWGGFLIFCSTSFWRSYFRPGMR